MEFCVDIVFLDKLTYILVGGSWGIIFSPLFSTTMKPEFEFLVLDE